jgi:uncharacterized protein
MTEVFADTHYFIAILGPDAPERTKARQAGTAGGRLLVTTSWVMTEVGSFMRRPYERAAFVQLVSRLGTRTNALLLPADSGLWRRGLELYEKRLDKEWSLVDCISFVVMAERKITDALTGDHHFEQAGFNALLK